MSSPMDEANQKAAGDYAIGGAAAGTRICVPYEDPEFAIWGGAIRTFAQAVPTTAGCTRDGGRPAGTWICDADSCLPGPSQI